MTENKEKNVKSIDITPIRFEDYIEYTLPFDACYNRIVNECADVHESIEHCTECALSYFRAMLFDDSYELDKRERYFFEGMVSYLEDKMRDLLKVKRKKKFTLKERFYILKALALTGSNAWSNLSSFQKEIVLSDLLDCHPDTVREFLERADTKSEKKMQEYLNQLEYGRDEKKG